VLLIFFALAGAGMGLTDTAESTLVARLLPDRLRGSGFGLLGGVQSVGDFVSSPRSASSGPSFPPARRSFSPAPGRR